MRVWCVHESIKSRADTDTKVQQSKVYLFSSLLVSVLTLLVYAGSPPAFDAVRTRKNGGRKMSEMSLHPVVTGYNRLASSAFPPSSHTLAIYLLHQLVIIPPPCQLVLVLGSLLVLLSLSC